jgi:hypothetical protein
VIDIGNIWITQDVIRDPTQLRAMISHVMNGGRWAVEDLRRFNALSGRRDERVVYVSRFPDGLEMIHDGHHRATATYMAGRRTLDDDEYEVVDWRYEEYTTVNWTKGFVTPLEPRTEVRRYDFYPWKVEVMRLAEIDRAAAMRKIDSERHLYCRPRVIKTIAELAWSFAHSEANHEIATADALPDWVFQHRDHDDRGRGHGKSTARAAV